MEQKGIRKSKTAIKAAFLVTGPPLPSRTAPQMAQQQGPTMSGRGVMGPKK
jgi:hypothetical protein